MVTLIIKAADGTVVFTQEFSSLIEAKTWLSNEQKQSYWKPTFVVSVIDNTAAIQAKVAAIQAADDASAALMAQKRAALKAVDLSKVATLDDAKTVIQKMMDVLNG